MDARNLKFPIVSGFYGVRSHIRVNIILKQRSSKAACSVQTKLQAVICYTLYEFLTQERGVSSG